MRVFYATFSFLLITVLAFVYAVDPAGRWHHFPFTETQTWSQDQCLVSPKDFDEMVFRAQHIPLIQRPEVVFMGSSRMLTASSVMVKRPAYNASMSGASIQDYVILWQVLKDHQLLPQMLVLELDPWVFNEGSEGQRWLSRLDLYGCYMIAQSVSPVDRLLARVQMLVYYSLRLGNEFSEGFNIEMLKLTLRVSTGREKRLDMHVAPLGSRPPDRRAYRWDGSYIYPEGFQTPKTPAGIRLIGEQYASQKSVYELQNWEFSTRKYKLAHRLIQDMRQSGVDVRLIAPPYQPRALELMMKRADTGAALESYEHSIQQLAADHHIQSCYRVKASAAGCSETEFLDGMHMLDTCVTKLLHQCLER